MSHLYQLYEDIVPKTADNFRKLCIGAGNAKTAPVPLHYKGSIFHRIFEGFMCQGGDIIKHNGTGNLFPWKNRIIFYFTNALLIE